jgi:hypothetical protein
MTNQASLTEVHPLPGGNLNKLMMKAAKKQDGGTSSCFHHELVLFTANFFKLWRYFYFLPQLFLSSIVYITIPQRNPVMKDICQ